MKYVAYNNRKYITVIYEDKDFIEVTVNDISTKQLPTENYIKITEQQYKKLVKENHNKVDIETKSTYYEKPFELTETAQSEKLKELESKFNEHIQRSSTEVPGIGKVDTGVQYLINVNTLLELCPDEGMKFKMFDNSVKFVSKEGLKLIKKHIQLKGVKAYEKKWYYEELIKNSINPSLIEINFNED